MYVDDRLQERNMPPEAGQDNIISTVELREQTHTSISVCVVELGGLAFFFFFWLAFVCVLLFILRITQRVTRYSYYSIRRGRRGLFDHKALRRQRGPRKKKRSLTQWSGETTSLSQSLREKLFILYLSLFLFFFFRLQSPSAQTIFPSNV